MDCPNSGLCCFDGCQNRCLEEEQTLVHQNNLNSQEDSYNNHQNNQEDSYNNYQQNQNNQQDSYSYQQNQNNQEDFYTNYQANPENFLSNFEEQDTYSNYQPQEEVQVLPIIPEKPKQTQTYIDNNSGDTDSSINHREPTLVLHIYGPPKSKTLVQFGNLPEKEEAGRRNGLRRRGNVQRRILHTLTH